MPHGLMGSRNQDRSILMDELKYLASANHTLQVFMGSIFKTQRVCIIHTYCPFVHPYSTSGLLYWSTVRWLPIKRPVLNLNSTHLVKSSSYNSLILRYTRINWAVK